MNKIKTFLTYFVTVTQKQLVQLKICGLFISLVLLGFIGDTPAFPIKDLNSLLVFSVKCMKNEKKDLKQTHMI